MTQNLPGIELKPFITNVIMSIFLCSSVAIADVYECNGQWTNKPCTGEVSKTIDKTKFRKAKGIENDVDSSQSPSVTEEILESDDQQPAQADDDAQKIEHMISGLQAMSRACNNFFSYGELKSFRQFCQKSSTSVQSCFQRWNDLYSKILGQVQDESCKNTVFSNVNAYESM